MPVTYLTNPREHDEATAQAHAGTPTVIYISYSPSPACKTFSSQYEKLATEAEAANGQTAFFQMEYNKETSPMMKFGPQHMPIIVALVKQKARTLLSPSVEDVRRLMEDLFSEEA